MNETPAYALFAALGNFVGETPLRAKAEALLNALGYSSQRTAEAGSVEEFIERFAPDGSFTERQRELFEPWSTVEVVFQFTVDEIVRQPGLLENSGFNQGRIESFLFLAVDMTEGVHTRTYLAETARIVNRLFAMPVIILFRHGPTLTLAATHRRAHKQDHGRDVLERVTLVKDIRVDGPHRAHVDILGELALPRLVQAGVRSFDDLHAKWEQALNIEALNKRFYREIFAWFERAVEDCGFPDDGAGEGSTERHVIRLITRLLFIWFLKEKRLVPEELFGEEFAYATLKNHAPHKTDYYRAVLQNLFFATLNTEVNKRAFSKGSNATHHDFSKYRYRSLLADPDSFVETLKSVPFVNGGLFDCLDDFAAAGAGGRRIDAFTDNKTQGQELKVPAWLFLDPQDGLFPLFRRYKFTVEENTPLDQEVALDPELLGRVFENLLAAYNPETRATARKATGSYYTPRPVVDYMVGEALTEALAANSAPLDGDVPFWRARLRYLFDHSDAMDDADELFEKDEKRAVVAAIAGIRTLDPAVGSGAFPMGILQTLTLALRRLDPGNKLWEETQKERAKDRAGEAFDTRDQSSRDVALREISATFEKYRQSDFGRKLYLIQNGIYGVDIQPIACQIAKLRFFISLVIEQDPDPGAPNLGVKPLPNLETKFVAADTLLELERPVQMELGQTDAIGKLEQELAANRERHFHAGDRSKKVELQKHDAQLRAQIAKRLSQIGFPAFTAETITRWDPYDQNAVAAWFDPEYMFGVVDGFDVVISNPPYIQLQKDGGHAGKLYQGTGYETFRGTGDIYQLFYERGCRLLKLGSGTLAYITSNSWLKAEYGKPLRRWFVEGHTPLRLVEMGKDVFEQAIVDTAVLVVRNGKDQPVTCQAVDVDQASDGRFPPPEEDWGTLQPKGDRPWIALSSVERAVMDKMEAVGTPLKEWDISIYRGILTGYNAAFIVDQPTRDALVAEDAKSAELLKPILRGRDIARYRAKWAGLWLISTFPSLGLDIDGYPAIKRPLLSFGKERLAQEGRRLPGGGRSRKKTPNAWYELQDTCAYHGIFASEKVIWIELVDRGRFAYDDSGTFIEATTFMVAGEQMKYLCAFLNSRLAHWYILKTAPTSGMGVLRWKKVYVEAIPVATPRPSSVATLHRLVDEAQSATSSDKKRLAQIEKRVDGIIYETYGISEGEAEVIELATKH